MVASVRQNLVKIIPSSSWFSGVASVSAIRVSLALPESCKRIRFIGLGMINRDIGAKTLISHIFVFRRITFEMYIVLSLHSWDTIIFIHWG